MMQSFAKNFKLRAGRLFPTFTLHVVGLTDFNAHVKDEASEGTRQKGPFINGTRHAFNQKQGRRLLHTIPRKMATRVNDMH